MNLSMMLDRFKGLSLHHIRSRFWWAWLLAGGVLAAAMVYGNKVSTLGHGLPSRFDIGQATSANARGLPEPILAGGGRLLDLTDEMAQTIVLPNGTDPSEVLRQFGSGAGTPLGKRKALSTSFDNNGNASLYVWFAYKTISQDPVLLRYRSLSPLLSAVWISDASGQTFDLMDLAGQDAPAYRAALPEHTNAFALRPSIALPASPDLPRQILVRIDSLFPYWSNFSLNASYAFERQRNERNYLDGVVLGALLVATAFAVYGLYYRQTIDYLSFLLATSAMCIWYLALGEHFVGTNAPFFRRFTFAGPVYLYFLLHGMGLHRLIYPRQLAGTKPVRAWRVLPLWLSAGYASVGLLCTFAYATFGLQTPGAIFINAMNEWLLLVAPALLLLAVLLAPDKRIPAFSLLLAVELVGALGSVLQFANFNSLWLEPRLAEVLIRYPLAIEVLLWAAALSSRFNYLEMIAKRRVKSALRNEARKVRAAMQATLQSREQALAALDNSYQALDQVRSSMLGIIDTHSHAAGNLLMRLGGHLSRIGRGASTDLPQHISAASKVLDELATTVQRTERAVAQAQSSQHALAPASSLLQWQADTVREQLHKRGVTLHLHIGTDSDMLLVDGYHFMEVARELLSNINRYAINGSVANVSLLSSATHITLCAENTAVLREDDQALRVGWPVSPAPSNFSDEQSSGRGLATLGTLLSGIGGTIQYDTRPPAQVIVTVVFPRR